MLYSLFNFIVNNLTFFTGRRRNVKKKNDERW